MSKALSPFARPLRPNPTVDHAVRLLSTWSGSDKLFMLAQYSSIIASVLLRRKGRVGSDPAAATVSDRFATLSRMCSESRMLYRLWGLLPIYQWLVSLSNPETQPQDRRLFTIERIQAISMLFYYPLEHTYFLSAKNLVPLSAKTTLQVALWSSRAWAVYVTLQLYHLSERFKHLRTSFQRATMRYRAAMAGQVGEEFSGEKRKQVAVVEGGEGGDEKAVAASELKALTTRRLAMTNEAIINLAYFPLTIHWSLEKGLYSSDLITGLCGTVAALAQIRAGWRATT